MISSLSLAVCYGINNIADMGSMPLLNCAHQSTIPHSFYSHVSEDAVNISEGQGCGLVCLLD